MNGSHFIYQRAFSLVSFAYHAGRRSGNNFVITFVTQRARNYNDASVFEYVNCQSYVQNAAALFCGYFRVRKNKKFTVRLGASDIQKRGATYPPPPDVHQACRSRELLKSESKEESTACRKVPRQMRRLFKGGGEDRVRGVFLPFLPCISFPLPFFLFHPLSSPRSCP